MADNIRVYAANTKVPVSRSKKHIEELIYKFGSSDVMIGEFNGQVGVMFAMNGRNIKFTALVPETEQKRRALYRNILLTIKAKLESAKAGIETFEEAFMSHIILPSGRTVADEVSPKIAEAYAGNIDIPLLGGW